MDEYLRYFQEQRISRVIERSILAELASDGRMPQTGSPRYEDFKDNLIYTSMIGSMPVGELSVPLSIVIALTLVPVGYLVAIAVGGRRPDLIAELTGTPLRASLAFTLILCALAIFRALYRVTFDKIDHHTDDWMRTPPLLTAFIAFLPVPGVPGLYAWTFYRASHHAGEALLIFLVGVVIGALLWFGSMILLMIIAFPLYGFSVFVWSALSLVLWPLLTIAERLLGSRRVGSRSERIRTAGFFDLRPSLAALGNRLFRTRLLLVCFATAAIGGVFSRTAWSLIGSVGPERIFLLQLLSIVILIALLRKAVEEEGVAIWEGKHTALWQSLQSGILPSDLAFVPRTLAGLTRPPTDPLAVLRPIQTLEYELRSAFVSQLQFRTYAVTLVSASLVFLFSFAAIVASTDQASYLAVAGRAAQAILLPLPGGSLTVLPAALQVQMLSALFVTASATSALTVYLLTNQTVKTEHLRPFEIKAANWLAAVFVYMAQGKGGPVPDELLAQWRAQKLGSADRQP